MTQPQEAKLNAIHTGVMSRCIEVKEQIWEDSGNIFVWYGPGWKTIKITQTGGIELVVTRPTTKVFGGIVYVEIGTYGKSSLSGAIYGNQSSGRRSPNDVCPICKARVRVSRLRHHLDRNHIGAREPLPPLTQKKPSAREEAVEEIGVPVEKVPFELLPPGSWDIEHIIAYYTQESDRFPLGLAGLEVQWSRLTAIKSLGPIKCYVGTELWLGYVVFEFSESDRVILECPIHGNATYVLWGDWKRMVVHSKFHLLTNLSHNCTKIVHKGDWIARVRAALQDFRLPARLPDGN